ncbi:MAG: hypothetical protein ACLGIY_06555 [Betaproteobacteria bacterium]
MTTTARAILAAGLVKLNMWNALTQAFNGFGDPLDADKFEIKPNFEEKTSQSKSHLDYGQARASVVLPKPTELTIELSAATVEALAMQFQGLVQSLTQASGAFAAQDFTLTALDQWLPLGKRSISDAGFEFTNAGDTVTYDLGTHYEVNWLRGLVRFHSAAAGAPAAAAVLKLTGTYGAVDGKKILGGRVTQVRCQVEFDGRNMVDGSPLEADVWEAVLGSDNGFDFLGSDFSAITLKGKIVTPPGKTEGYEIRLPGAST